MLGVARLSQSAGYARATTRRETDARERDGGALAQLEHVSDGNVGMRETRLRRNMAGAPVRVAVREKALSLSFARIVGLVLAVPAAVVTACVASAEHPVVDASMASDGGVADGAPDPCAPTPYDASTLEGDAAGCAELRLLPCGMPPKVEMRGCSPDLLSCAQICNLEALFRCQLSTASCDTEAGIYPDAALLFECITCAGSGGRRPRGLVPMRARASTLAAEGDLAAVGAYFAKLAYLEAASVRAFRELAAALTRFVAPRALVVAAHASSSDERRHARAVRRLAARFGVAPPRPAVARERGARAPSLAEMLDDSVVEGCIFEGYSALLLQYQARAAGDPRTARTLSRIADDEARHVALAWEILAWGLPRVDVSTRCHLRQSLERALATLEAQAAPPPNADVARIAGAPSPEATRRLTFAFTRFVRAEADGVFGVVHAASRLDTNDFALSTTLT